MIFRLSQKLQGKLKVGTLTALPLHENHLLDWSAHVFLAGRTQYVLLTNTKSLVSTIFPGKGLTNEGTFIQQGLTSIQEVLEAGLQRCTIFLLNYYLTMSSAILY